MRSKFAVFTLLFVLSACATLGIKRPVPENEVGNIHNIAVASGFHPFMHHIFIGTTVFSNTENIKPVPEWRIPEYAEVKLVDALKKRHIGDRVDVFLPGGKRPKSDQDYMDYYQAARNAGYDTVVFARPTHYTNERFLKPGYGLYLHRAFGMGEPCAYAVFVVEVVKTSGPEQLGWEWGHTSKLSPATGACYGSAPWKDNVDNLTAEEMKQLETTIKSHIASGIDGAIGALNLK